MFACCGMGVYRFGYRRPQINYLQKQGVLAQNVVVFYCISLNSSKIGELHSVL